MSPNGPKGLSRDPSRPGFDSSIGNPLKTNNLTVSKVNLRRTHNADAMEAPGGLDSPFVLSEQDLPIPDYDMYSEKSNLRISKQKSKSKNKKFKSNMKSLRQTD